MDLTKLEGVSRGLNTPKITDSTHVIRECFLREIDHQLLCHDLHMKLERLQPFSDNLLFKEQ